MAFKTNSAGLVNGLTARAEEAEKATKKGGLSWGWTRPLSKRRSIRSSSSRPRPISRVCSKISRLALELEAPTRSMPTSRV